MIKITARLIPVISVVALALITSCESKDVPVYKDSNASIEARVDDLLGRMTVEEKFWQLFMIPGDISEAKEKYKHGIFGIQVATKSSTGNEVEQILEYSSGGQAKETAMRINEMQKYFLEETRLGIPIIPFDEALHGLIREGATAFPQAIGLAASFNTKLMDTVAAAIATELKARGIQQNLSPVINIARDVRWGRVEETYGEDPYLSSRMAVSYIKAFEERKIITTPKHFVANVGDGGRDSYPIHYNDRILEEVYYPAFKASVKEAKAWSIMTAYNSVDGLQATANSPLLRGKLKEEWGFEGFVISDAGAVGGANVLHFTAKDYADATKQAIEGGLDVIFQTSYNHYPLFYEAFEKGIIDEKAINEAVKRVLYAKFKLGLFEDPYVNVDDLENENSTTKNKGLAKLAALESLVLLKNEAAVLPLKKTLKSIAVIGPDAAEARLGGYSGPGNNPVSILEGIKNKVGDTLKVDYLKGVERVTEDFVAIPEDQFFHVLDGKKSLGLQADYFNNIKLEGEPALSRIDPKIDFRWTLFSPDPERINYDFFSARWQGKLKAPMSGKIDIGIKGDDGYRLYINGELFIDNWRKQTVQQITKPYQFEKDQTYDIKVEFFETRGNVWFKLIWNANIPNNWQTKLADAVSLAKKSDVAIVCVGIEEGEFKDRAFLSLPGHQEKMIKAIAETGTPTVVVLTGGSAITMQNWVDEVPAIIDAWYSGDEGGNAIADALFGDYNPAGRLPITFPIHESQLPLYYNHKPTGRGDDYSNLSGKPLFPFGFGLSYTQFEYSDLQLDKSSIRSTDSLHLKFRLSNTGEYDGDEVVQLYIKDEYASVARPVIELKAFQRIHLKKGETKTVQFEITPAMLTLLNQEMVPVVEPGDFRIMIGSSSNDIRLREILCVE
ncbi:glycoside hydrolase family 3 C-terminal domain-containing protein [Croceimicrobium sp.]|uniref:beta-glucosidase n=1 Tax=Croceimicrobium sp. TaxID=2828340 RepID=UPI003BABE79E